jgi:hypothetical protein
MPRSSISGWPRSTPSATTVGVHKHLRRLERVWIDFPIYFITTCVDNRKAVLAEVNQPESSWKNGWRLMNDMVGPLADMSSCRITCISFVGLKSVQRLCLNLLGIGRVGPAEEFTH